MVELPLDKAEKQRGIQVAHIQQVHLDSQLEEGLLHQDRQMVEGLLEILGRLLPLVVVDELGLVVHSLAAGLVVGNLSHQGVAGSLD